MVEATTGGGTLSGAAPASSLTTTALARYLFAALALIAIALAAYTLHTTPGRGARASFALLSGAALGIAFQRGRFCFYCILRDFIQRRDSGPIYAILTALAVGGVGYAIVFGQFLPNATAGRLPPDAHIGPVSWVVAAGGLTFGLGMVLSGACISGHLYRLGEGYARAPIALFGSLIGFGLGFFTWRELYISTLVRAPVAWLPGTFGYAGALAIHLTILGAIALLLLRFVPELPARPAGRITLARIRDSILGQRWNPLLTGAIVGLIGVFLYFRVEPLGVTSQIGSLTRTFMTDNGWLTDRLNGLDTFSGCATAVVNTITENGLLIGGLVAGSLAAALASNRFKLSRLTVRNSLTALIGGALMGWGAMVSLGCTVGTLLSGISAFAISGWIFGAAVFAGVWIGLKLRLESS